MNKTPITVLQEMMIRLGFVPEYECIAQSGPHHQMMFEYRCSALGKTVMAEARSKKDAKQESARLLLLELARSGHAVPPPYCVDTSQGQTTSKTSALSSSTAPVVNQNSYVTLLKELQDEYRLPAMDYELVGDTGPAHQRQFTMRASMGQHSRLATATTKRGAKQAAAEMLYKYLRENLRSTKEFVEEAALVRAHERVMERYRDVRAEGERPRLEQRPAGYHDGLREQFDANKRIEALKALSEEPAEVALSCAVSVLGIQEMWAELPRLRTTPLYVVSLDPTAPPLAFAGETKRAAAANAVKYMRAAMRELPEENKNMQLNMPMPMDVRG